ncbi:ABC transporter substrate-binding protein [Anaerosporobacter faecicola]|uniref:ABC transporter substrate-binding protein n=1 Tax=Anaerosporobacter faecicola TaxID=2718714 RepID=UPI00143B0A26|nr:extracellular solute-binding protein [Anaerosporobacter faecicola]
MRKNKRALCILVVLSMVVSSVLAGCGKKDKKTTNEVKGRYIEEEQEIPEEIKNLEVIKMVQSEKGQPILYAYEDQGESCSVSKYERSEDGTWKIEQPQWLQDIPIMDKEKLENPSMVVDNICLDQEGKEYLTYSEYNGYTGLTYLCTSSDGKERTYLDFEGWNEAIEDDQGTYYDTPMGVGVLYNGDVIAELGGDVIIYDQKSGEKKASYQGDGLQIKAIAMDQNSLYITRKNWETDCIDQIYKFDLNNYDKKPEEIPYEQKINSYSTCININDEGDLFLVDTEGIHVQKAGTTLWNTTVLGELNTMYMPTAMIVDVYEDTQDNYYVLYRMDATGYQLIKYVYDPDVVTVPNKNLTVYTLEDNILLREAAVVYNKKHPDTMIAVEVAKGANDTTETEDYVKALNTELLAGKGPDILITDGLPVDSYVKKGVLLDLQEIVNPMVESGELLANVMDDYTEEGHYYTVPIRISPYYVAGRTDTVNACSTFDDLVDASSQTWNKSFLGEITPSDVIANFLPTQLSKIIKKDGQKKEINHQELVTFLEKAKTLCANVDIVDEYSHGGVGNIFDLPYYSQITLGQVQGFYDFSFIYAVTDLIKGSIGTYDASYIGSNEIGVNQNTKYPDVAKEFIQILLSEDIQVIDYSNGMAVNTKAIKDNLEKEENEGGCTEIQNEKGEYVLFTINWIGKEKREEISKFCEKFQNRVVIDQQVLNVISEEFIRSIKSESSMEDCAAKIENELNIYLSE